MAQEHVSNTGRIWKVFGILSAVTVVEVYLGILKPDFLHMNNFLSMSLLNWIFFALTIYKAYYIVYAFMHMDFFLEIIVSQHHFEPTFLRM